MNAINKIRVLCFLILVTFYLSGCTTSFIAVKDTIYNARERDVFDNYKTITENKYQNETLYLRDVLIVDSQRNGFQPFAFRTLDVERFANTVYQSLTKLGIMVEKQTDITNIFDIDGFYIFREGSSKNMENFVTEYLNTFVTER